MNPYLVTKNKELCYGCGACKQACPQIAITMEADQEGFSYPSVDSAQCTGCGVCNQACPFSGASYSFHGMDNPGVCAAWHTNEAIRADSSSGGIFSALAQQMINQKGVVFGALFDDDFTVRHDAASDMEGCERFRGSKYLQSDIRDTYRMALQALTDERPVLFSGTPCQIAGLYGFLGKDYDNLLTCDIVCTGAPSPIVFKAYKTDLESVYKSRIQSIRFKDKEKGWKKPTLRIEFADRQVYRCALGKDPYIKFFFQHFSTRPSCSACRFTKTSRESDITIGDFWGLEKTKPHLIHKQGVSVVLLNSEKGSGFFTRIKESVCFEECLLEDTLQPRLQFPAKTPDAAIRAQFFRDVKKGFSCASSRYLLYNAEMFLRKLWR